MGRSAIRPGLVAILAMGSAAIGLVWAQSPYPQGQYPPSSYPQGQNPQGWDGSNPGPDDADPDAPNHGAARLSVMNGNVSVRRGDSSDVVAASLNAPVMATDRVETGDGARAEIQFDYSNMVRLAQSTEVRIGDLAYRHYQIQVAQGLVTFRVLRDSAAQVEISTPSVSVHPMRAGVYRVLVGADGVTQITVRSGEATIFSPSGSEPLHAGQTMLSRGSSDDPEFQVVGAVQPDEFDRWNADRDSQLMHGGDQVYRHVSPDVAGAEDLNGYGQWQNDPQYGDVWVPQVPADWAPYRDGRWVWEDYYGWTWVSYDPWGWAPYHYGRWYRGGSGWAWYPGPIGYPNYWSPALVGFFGWGSGFGVGFGGFGFGNVGWVALAPYERFHPWYGRGFAGGRNFAIAGGGNLGGVYRNARFVNGVTSMRAGEFGRTGVNSRNFVRASAGDLSRAGAVRGAMPFTPSRESRQFSSASANTRGVPRTNDNARFFSSSRSTGFGSGGSSSSAGSRGFGSSSPHSFSNNAPSGAAAGNGGWRRFDPTGRDAGAAGRSSQGLSGSSAQGSSFSNRGSNTRVSPGAAGSSQSGGWNTPPNRGAGSGSSGFGQAPSRGYTSPGVQNYGGQPRTYSPSPSAPQSRNFGGSQPVRISPQIVHERGAPSGGGSQPRSNNFGGSRTSGSSGGGARGGGGSPSHGGGGGGSHGGHR